MNWHLIKQDCLPIAVPTHNRQNYFHALGRADNGYLAPFVGFLGYLSRGMVRLVVGDDAEARSILGPPHPPDMTLGYQPDPMK